MSMDGGATLNNLKHQCESLKPGTEYVIQITQQKLDEQFKKVITNEGCNVKIEKKNGKTVVVVTKKKGESDENLLAGLGNMGAGPVEEPDWLKEKEKQVVQKEKQVVQKEKQVVQKEKQVAKIERVALMNPSRELRDMIELYNKELDKKYIDVNKFYKKVKEAHKAILAPGSYIDSDTYKIFITDGAVKMIIGDLRRKLKQPYYNKYKGEINEIIRLLKEIDDKSKPKDYGLY